MSTWALALFGMPEDERRRLTGENGRRTRPRRGGRRHTDPMDAFVYAVVGMMVAVVLVYCIVLLRTKPGDEPPSAALQGLLGVIPLATALIAFRRNRRDSDD